MFFLDTNTCIYFLNGKSESIKEKILSTPPSQIGIPVIVKAELILGAYKSQSMYKIVEKVEHFLEPFEIIPFENSLTYTYAEIRSELEKMGQPIGPNDLLIAAITKLHEATLITNNEKEFKRIKDLRVENWHR